MIRNRRDLGGTVTKGGLIIRPGCLIRSGNLYQAEEYELKGVSEILDFRTGVESEKMPDQIPPQILYRQIPIFNESAAGITREGDLSEVPNMRELYRLMLEDDGYRAQLYVILDYIFRHDYSTGAILWHCTAGKDRCGIVTALVLLALNTDRETIMKDYLRSNDDCVREGDEIFRKLIESGFSEDRAHAVREVFLAKQEYLTAAMDAYDRNPLKFPEFDSFRQTVLAG